YRRKVRRERTASDIHERAQKSPRGSRNPRRLHADRDPEPHIRIGTAQIGPIPEGRARIVELDQEGVVAGNPGAEAAPKGWLERESGGREVRGVREARNKDARPMFDVDGDGAPGVVAGSPAQVRREERSGQRRVELDDEGVDPAGTSCRDAAHRRRKVDRYCIPGQGYVALFVSR